MSPSASPTHVFFHRRQDLRTLGWTDRRLRSAIESGTLVRPRANAYLAPDAAADLIDACALGGRLACVSELARLGVFVLEAPSLHVHLRDRRGSARGARPIRLHWGRLRRTPHPRSMSVEVFDALLLAARCQPARAMVASLDSALYRGILREGDLEELFHALPRRHRILRRLLDPRAESGPESLVRLILRALGAGFEVQVDIDGVGRVDFVVDGWLIIECDSEEFHSTWEQQRRDRRRDQAAAALGYATYRPIAEDIMWHPERVRAAIDGLLRSAAARRR